MNEVDDLRAALDAVERECRYLDKLSDGDRHYSKLFRSAVAGALNKPSNTEDNR